MRQQRLPCASHPNLYYFHEVSREVEVTPYLGEATVISRSIDTPSDTPQVSGDISQRPPMSLFRVGAFPEAPRVSHTSDVGGDSWVTETTVGQRWERLK